MGIMTIDERRKTVDIDMDFTQIKQADVDLLYDMKKLGYDIGSKTQRAVHGADFCGYLGGNIESLVKNLQVASDVMFASSGHKKPDDFDEWCRDGRLAWLK